MIRAAKENQGDLIFVKELIETGKVKPVIDRYYPLNEAAQALLYYGEGHSSGKVVITVHDSKVVQVEKTEKLRF